MKYGRTVLIALILFPALIMAGEPEDEPARSVEELERHVRQLEKELWTWKHLVMNPGLSHWTDLDRDHSVDHRFRTRTATEEESAQMGLKPGEGLHVRGVSDLSSPYIVPTDEIPLRKRDLIARVLTPFGSWLPATETSIKYACLPHDTVKFEVFRKGEKLIVEVEANCDCSKGNQCEYASPIGSEFVLPERARMLENEMKAYRTVRDIGYAQSKFTRARCVDTDKDGQGENGTLAEMSGIVKCRKPGLGMPSKPGWGGPPGPYLPEHLGRTDDKGRVIHEGYYFVMYLPGKDRCYTDADLAKAEDPGPLVKPVVVYGFPVEPGVTGRSVFVGIGAYGRNFFLENKEGKWGGDVIPPPGLAFPGGADPSKGRTFPLRDGAKGGADEPWRRMQAYPWPRKIVTPHIPQALPEGFTEEKYKEL
ncbi:MAG: hypothetical protein ACYTFG_13425, partial [Planctomycetota bacterium]